VSFLHVERVTKHYGPTLALSEVELSVAKAETLALLGPNGAGKTTLMRILSGVERPESGKVSLDGLGDPATPAVRRAIGFAPQALAVYPQLSARENLRFFAELYSVPRAELDARVEYGLQVADLQSRADQRTGGFSAGMQRRLNLACAVVHRPQLLLLDEPTVGVDPHTRNHLLESVAALRETGVALIYSTHLMEEADRLCDRVAIMDHGRLLTVGTREALCAQHDCADLSALFLALTGNELRD